MRNRGALGLLVIALSFGCESSYRLAQAQLQAAREIKLPVPASLGAFGWEEPAKEHVAIAVAPDRSLLVLDPDADGDWLLVRVRNWWTETPATEVLRLAGLTGRGGIACCSVDVELQVTPDGRHAVAFAGMVGLGPLFKHKNYVPRPPITIITVVDLEHWTIAKSMHVQEWSETDVRGARILNDGWVAVQGLLPEEPTHPYAHLYERRNLMFSIPGLQAGPQCVSRWTSENLPVPQTPSGTWDSIAQSQDKKNNEDCAALLRNARLDTVKDWESLIYKGHRTEPRNLLLQSLYSGERLQEELEQPRFPQTTLEEERHLYFDHWNEPDEVFYAISPSYESATHDWYALRLSFGGDVIHSTLGVFDSSGKLLKDESVPGALCDGEKNHGWNSGVCGCHIEGVSEEEHTLMAYCRMQRGDYAGMVLKQWISVVRTDDFSNAGSVILSKAHNEPKVLASVNDHAYVLVISAGQVLKIYDVTRSG
jgi:hypothetical protein